VHEVEHFFAHVAPLGLYKVEAFKFAGLTVARHAASHEQVQYHSNAPYVVLGVGSVLLEQFGREELPVHASDLLADVLMLHLKKHHDGCVAQEQVNPVLWRVVDQHVPWVNQRQRYVVCVQHVKSFNQFVCYLCNLAFTQSTSFIRKLVEIFLHRADN
jgi:hypothetical protein